MNLGHALLARASGASRTALYGLAALMALRFAWVGLAPLFPSDLTWGGAGPSAPQAGRSLAQQAKAVLKEALPATSALSVEEIMAIARDPGDEIAANSGAGDGRRSDGLVSVTLGITDVPEGSEVFVNHAKKGRAPYIGELSCSRGSKLTIEVIPPKGTPILLEGDCQPGALRPSRRVER